jgi:Cytotoxic translational repressor of toxin-antitoxin stability system
MYRIVFTQKAFKDLEQLDERTKLRIGKKIKEYAKDHFRHGRKLTDPKIGTYRFRIGNCRVIFDISDEDIVILRVGHRRNVYK